MITDFILPKLVVPEVIFKDQSSVRILGYVVSDSAKKYWNVSFVGVMAARDGMPEEYVIGQLELDKVSMSYDQGNVRYSRFKDKRGLAMFHTAIGNVLMGNK